MTGVATNARSALDERREIERELANELVQRLRKLEQRLESFRPKRNPLEVVASYDEASVRREEQR